MGTAVVAKDFSTKVSKVQVTDEATARQWFAETRVNLDDDPDVVSPITFQARQIMINFLPADAYNEWYEKCQAWTNGHDDDQPWTDHDAAECVVKLLTNINNRFGAGDITNDQIEEMVVDAAASMPGLSKIVTKDDWKSFYGHYLSLDKKDFRKFSGQTIVDFLSFIFNKITKMEDDEMFRFEKASEAAASHKSIHEIGNDLWYFFHHDSSLDDDDEYEPDDEPEEKEEDQKKKEKAERRAKVQEIIAGLYDLQKNSDSVISVVLDDKKRENVKKVKSDAAAAKKDSNADTVIEDTGANTSVKPEVIDAKVLDEKVVENPPAVQSTIDLNKLMPAPIPEDQYHDLMDQVQKSHPYIPWHVTRATVSALLNCIGRLSLESIFAEIKAKNDQTGQEWYPAYAEIINSITSAFSPLGPIVPGVKADELTDVISKDALLNIATGLDNQLGGDKDLERIIEKIRKYQSPQATESDVVKNPFVYVNGSATTSSVLPESTRKQVLKAFGDLLNNRTYNLESIGNGNIIQLSFPDRQQAYWIDPSIIIGDGFNLYWQADSPIMINISRNRDIIKKILDDPNYALTPEEYNRVRACQFKNDGLYDCLDMSGMSRNINGMNADTMFKFEEKLNKIFGIDPQTGAFSNPVFQGYGKLFRFRFSKFKSIDDFTLVSDEKVKSPVQGVNDILPGMTVLVYKNNYIVKYNEQSFQVNF